MATFNAFPYSGLLASPQTLPGADLGYGGKTISFIAQIANASQASGSVFRLWKARSGLIWRGGEIIVDTSTSTATLAIGNATTSTLYKAAGAVTTTGIPQLFFDGGAGFLATMLTAPLAVPEEVLLTVGTAALPASGNTFVIGHYMTP